MNIHVHSHWKSNENEYGEVALLEFAEIPITKAILPIKLWGSTKTTEKDGIFAGWEKTSSDGSKFPKQIEAPIWPDVECIAESPIKMENPVNKSFCTNLQNGVCFDNTGNGFFVPAYDEYRLKGIVKFTPQTEGKSCDQTKFPVYVDLEKYEKWIEEHFKQTTPEFWLEKCQSMEQSFETSGRFGKSLKKKSKIRSKPKQKNRAARKPSRKSPVLSPCFAIDHYFDDETGEYLKSSCIIEGGSSYETSEAKCRSRQMELFVISDETMQEKFNEAMTESLIDYPGGRVWINGKFENGDWFTHSPEKSPLMNETIWVKTETIDGRAAGPCLEYSSQYGPYMAVGSFCSSAIWSVCEFHEQPVKDAKSCWKTKEIFDETGQFIKTACIFNYGRRQWKSHQHCRSLGMNLFIVDDFAVEAQILSSPRKLNSALIGSTGDEISNQNHGLLMIQR